MLEINKVYLLKNGEEILIDEIRIFPEGIFYKSRFFAKMYRIEDFQLPKKTKK